MKLKTKLQLGVGFLFLLIFVLGGASAWYINRLSHDAQDILKDNYLTIDISKSILRELGNDNHQLNQKEVHTIDGWLQRQKQNITEKGESEVTIFISNSFDSLKKQVDITKKISLKTDIREHLYQLIEINIQAIIKRNNVVMASSKNATIYIAIFGSICVLIAFSFIVNFPGYVANPIKDITEGIKEISNKNYKKRIHLDRKDEFAELAEAFNLMAGRLYDFENSNLALILFEKLRLETIINHMRDAVIGLDAQKNILFANPIALSLLNTNFQSIVGKYAPDIAIKNDLMREILADSQQNELKIYSDEKESYFTKELFEIKAPDDEQQELSKMHFGTVILLKNITKYHELDVAKTNFMATISHELKTPISAIKMSLKLLKDVRVGDMNKEQTDLVKNIDEDTQRLLKLTSEMLDLTQLETGNIQLNIQEIQAGEILEYAIQATKFSASQKQIEFNLLMDEHLPLLLADVEKTAWVMINFISNAIRYSPEKAPITLKIKKQLNFIAFTVIDLGKGIDEKYQKRIFERYFQVPSDNAHKGGTGLGLAISKEFIEAQNGSVFVESEVGTGSTFGFLLPIKNG